MMNFFNSFPNYQSINGEYKHTHARFLYQDASMSQVGYIHICINTFISFV
jgi:hypothetical protein